MKRSDIIPAVLHNFILIIMFGWFSLQSSNCVVNLTADKKVVLKEAYRVLKVRC